MLKRVSLLVLLVILSVGILLLGCAASTPSPTAKPTTIPTPKPTAASSPSPSAKPAPKTTTAPAVAPVSFAGKTITIVVPTAPGGGNDIIARAWGRFLPNFLPGRPNVIINNMTAGQGIMAGNYVYEAKPTGLTTVIGSGQLYMPYLTGMSAAKYDLKKMNAVLGNATANVYFMKPGIVSKVEDLPKAKGLVFGNASGATGYMFVSAIEMLEIKPDKVILAYAGSGDALRAFLAGEINTCGQTTSGYVSSVQPLVQKGEVQVLWQAGVGDDKGNLIRDPGVADIATAKEVHEKIYGKAPTGMLWDQYSALADMNGTYAKALLLPPGTPDNIKQVYYEASEKMIKDPDFRKAIDPLVGASSAWFAGKGFDDQFRNKMNMNPAIIQWIKDTFRKYGIEFN